MPPFGGLIFRRCRNERGNNGAVGVVVAVWVAVVVGVAVAVAVWVAVVVEVAVGVE